MRYFSDSDIEAWQETPGLAAWLPEMTPNKRATVNPAGGFYVWNLDRTGKTPGTWLASDENGIPLP